MALIDDIEFYGRAVTAGDMTLDDAINALVKASSNGLKPPSARNEILNWQTSRARYEAEYNRASDGLASAREEEAEWQRTGRIRCDDCGTMVTTRTLVTLPDHRCTQRQAARRRRQAKEQQ